MKVKVGFESKSWVTGKYDEVIESGKEMQREMGIK